MIDGKKYCHGCNSWKPLSNFWKLKASKDRYHSGCKQCYNKQRINKRKKDPVYAEIVRQRVRQNWNKGKEKYNERRRRLQQTDVEVRAKWLESQHKSYYKHHEERKRKLRERPPEKKYEDNQKQKNNGNMRKFDLSEKGRLRSAKHNAKKRELGFGFNLVFPNELDEPFAYHHFNHNNVDVVAIPVEIHQLYGNPDSRKHRDNLLPIVEQLYPGIISFLKK